MLNTTLSIESYYRKQHNERRERAGLIFPVTRIGTAMRRERRFRVSDSADVYMAAVLEGLAVDVFDFVSKKYSSKPMIDVEMVKEGIRSSIHQPI